MICETLATESCASPADRAASRTLPGALLSDSVRVNGTTTVVAMRLRLKALPCTTSTGRSNPGPEPLGGASFAHQTSP